MTTPKARPLPPPPGMGSPKAAQVVESSSSDDEDDVGTGTVVVGLPPPPPGFDDDEPQTLPPVLARSASSRNIPGLASPEQVAELKEFLKWKEPLKPDDFAERFLSMHLLVDAAEGIRDRYGMLPAGWRGLVTSNQIARGLPRGLSREKFDVDLKKKEDESLSVVDKKINEIIDTEQRFVSVITETQKNFVDELFRIIGKTGSKAAKRLGLTQEELIAIFEPLPQIVRFSQGLLAKLELISLVRKEPVSGEGRAIYVGEAFVAMAPKLHVYAPAITSYQNSLNILNQAVAKVKSNPSKKGVETFLDIWESIIATNEVLRGQQLQSVLIQPMQRVPRYKMLLETLLKDSEPHAIPVCKKALDMFASAATAINGAVKTHEKLADFFGAENGELKPLTSSADAKGNEIKIKQEYHNKLL